MTLPPAAPVQTARNGRSWRRPSDQRQIELGQIHSAAQRLGLSEEARRSVFFLTTGERSSSTFSAKQRAACLRFLEAQLQERIPVGPTDYGVGSAVEDELEQMLAGF